MAVRIDPQAIIQTVDISQDDLKFKTPCSLCISGSSMSGKTEFMIKLITHRKELFDTEFDEIFYCTPETTSFRYSPVFERLQEVCPNIQLINGVPDIQKLNLTLDTRPKILFCDDLQEELLQSETMLTLMTGHIHHFQISLCFSLQNFYSHSRFGRTIFRQIKYRVIFYNRLDMTEIRGISSQICQPPKFLIESFEFLFSTFDDPAYILIDGFSQSPLRQLFVRTHIFPGENPIFFFPK